MSYPAVAAVEEAWPRLATKLDSLVDLLRQAAAAAGFVVAAEVAAFAGNHCVPAAGYYHFAVVLPFAVNSWIGVLQKK